WFPVSKLSPCRFPFTGNRDHHLSPSFPTRRSSDLTPSPALSPSWRAGSREKRPPEARRSRRPCRIDSRRAPAPRRQSVRAAVTRSEEHTSELQSRMDLVCRLLLAKKKHTDLLLAIA